MNGIYKLIKDLLLEWYRDAFSIPKKITCDIYKKELDVRRKYGILSFRIVPCCCPFFKKRYKCNGPITSVDGPAEKQNKLRIKRDNNAKCYIANKKTYSAVCFLLIILFLVIFLLFIFFKLNKIRDIKSHNANVESETQTKDNDEKVIQSISQLNRQTEPLKLGPLKIGGEMPGGPGDTTFAPYMKIPISKFYVSVVEPDTGCINEDCNLDGAYIQTMGGWLEVKHTGVTIDELFGLDMPENKNIKSIVLIGDQDGKIAGIYPNGGLDDVISILKLHPDLADFDLLKGVDEFGSFRIGEFAPLKPGDPITHLSDKLAKFATHIPKDKKFYLYSVQKMKYEEVGIYERYENKYRCVLSGCRYPEPDPPHDFLFADIDDLGGWFLTNDQDNSEMVKLFGLDQEEILEGKFSLVVLTDSKGIIQAIHPNKTMSDALTILSYHPDLADVEGLYRK